MTHADVDHEDLHREVEAFVREKIGDVVSVEIGDDRDRSGDRFMTLTVVVEGSTKALVRERPPGLLRQLRAMLLDRGFDAFPSINLVSASEAA